MKKIIFLCLAWSGVFAQQNLKLWYEKPATEWVEALPVGNGQIGAMIFGGVDEELIQLNEGTLWSGGPRKANVNPESHKYLQPIRDALAQKDYFKAQELTKKMQGLYTESFMPLGDLKIKQTFKNNRVAANYHRELDISNAVSVTQFTKDGVTYKREVFASAPDNVIVIRFTADKPGTLTLDLNLDSKLKPQINVENGNELHMQAKAPAGVDPNYFNKAGREAILWSDPSGCNGMRVRTILKAINEGGTLTADQEGLHLKDANGLVVYLTATTSFNGYDKCPDSQGKDEKAIAKATIARVGIQNAELIKKKHIEDYKSFFDRLSLKIDAPGVNPVNDKLPSELRLRSYAYGNNDPGLEILYFQYGRYLLISSSRGDGSAANLQGIWNKEMRPPWSSNYTININTQMNYWPAESGNLAELHKPLIHFVKNLSKTGALTAQEFYKAKGWVAHHNSDIWALSNPVGNVGEGDPVWANWYMGGAWLSQHLWEHYAFNGDNEYLKNEAYPVMKEAAIFCSDWLIERNGYLVTSPSTTPENLFWIGDKRISVSEATTMDMAIIRDLFRNVIEASEILGVDKKLRDELIQKKAKLFPYKIGAEGQLQEWSEDFKEVDPKHRHLSHLFGLHPGRDISPLTTPELAKATERTFELRGDEGTGWSKGWKINFAARLLDGNHAYKMIREIMRFVEPNANGVGGTYLNFFDAHPPFQIDGNFGATAGFIEMLVQSHLNEIHLLPALPDAWPSGEVKGIKARGNFEVDVTWKDGQLSQATLKSIIGGNVTLRTEKPITVNGTKATQKKDGKYYLNTFSTQKGTTYSIKMQ